MASVVQQMLGITLALGLLASTDPTQAAPTYAQRKLARQCDAALRLAKEAIDAGKFERAVALVRRVQQEIAKLEGAADPNDREMTRILGPLKRRTDQTRGVLELEGFDLPPISVAVKKPIAPAEGPPAAEPGPQMVSFKGQIAPILVRRCVGCHGGNKPKGDLSMETYALLDRGAGGAAIIEPGQSSVSEIIGIIKSGDMPKGSGKVSLAELTLLAKWIDLGAKFDGQNSDTPLRQLASASQPAPSAPNPTKPGELAFSTHIAPILAQHCTNCHGGQRPRNRLNLTNFSLMMRGGMSGAAVRSGNVNGSLLIQKIKGTAPDGNRMPLDAPPLPANVISNFEKWVASGAKFDGPDPQAPVQQVAALTVARSSSHEQLSAQRAELADKNWKLALADVKAAAVPTDNFLVYGDADGEKIDEIASTAEEQQSQIRALLALPADGPLVKGRTTLFVFGLRVDYSEFAYMVEKRKLDKDVRGHWRYSIVDAYGCIVPPSRDEYGLPALVAQQIAGAAIAARSSSPRWFSEGVARAVAAKIQPDDARVARWNDQLEALRKQVDKPDDFMTGKLPPEQADILSYGFAQRLMSDKRGFSKALASLWDGKTLEQAMQSAYGQPPAELAAAWIKSGSGSRGRRKR